MLKSHSKVTKDGHPASPKRDRDVRTEPGTALGPGQAGTGCSRRNEEPLVVAQGQGSWGHCGTGDGTSRRSGTKVGALSPASCALGSRAAMGAGNGGEQGWARVGGRGSVPSSAWPHSVVSKEVSAALGMGSAWHAIAAMAQITAGAPESPHPWAAGLGCTAQPHPLQLWAPTSTPGRLGSSPGGSIWGGPAPLTCSHVDHPQPRSPTADPSVWPRSDGARSRGTAHPAPPSFPPRGRDGDSSRHATASTASPPQQRQTPGQGPHPAAPRLPRQGRERQGRGTAAGSRPPACKSPCRPQRCSLCGATEGARSWGHPPVLAPSPGCPQPCPCRAQQRGQHRPVGTGQDNACGAGSTAPTPQPPAAASLCAAPSASPRSHLLSHAATRTSPGPPRAAPRPHVGGTGTARGRARIPWPEHPPSPPGPLPSDCSMPGSAESAPAAATRCAVTAQPAPAAPSCRGHRARCRTPPHLPPTHGRGSGQAAAPRRCGAGGWAAGGGPGRQPLAPSPVPVPLGAGVAAGLPCRGRNKGAAVRRALRPSQAAREPRGD